MKQVINPGLAKKSINLIDNIVYSHQKDLNGNPMELKMSIMLQNGNSEMRLAAGEDDPKADHSPKPALLWIPGGGWRGADKNLMLGEMSEFARAGYVVASMYYRSSAEGHWPDQIIDVLTAIRFLRANAEKYEINPDKIGVFGRSAGGHLATFAACNLDGYAAEEWKGYSSKVQACINMFGPTDVTALMLAEQAKLSDPNFRWHKLEETHGGALLGGDPDTMVERSAMANVRKGALLLPRLGRGDMSAHGQPQRTQSGQNLVGIQGSFLLFQLGQMLQLPDCLLLPANVGAKMQKGKLATGCHIVHKSFSRAPGIKGQEGSREDKAVVMAISKAPDVVHHLLVDKDCFPCSYRKRPVQGAHLDVPGQQIKKLQIPVPVHYLKAGISGIGPVVDDVQDEVRKIRAAFQVDRLQILFLFQQQCPLR